jgi:oligopeptide/dipeptide ABC transporter ATP-binding protein
LADRIAVMKNGRIIEIGDTRTVIEQPSHPYTIKLLSAVPSLERRSSAY